MIIIIIIITIIMIIIIIIINNINLRFKIFLFFFLRSWNARQQMKQCRKWFKSASSLNKNDATPSRRFAFQTFYHHTLNFIYFCFLKKNSSNYSSPSLPCPSFHQHKPHRRNWTNAWAPRSVKSSVSLFNSTSMKWMLWGWSLRSWLIRFGKGTKACDFFFIFVFIFFFKNAFLFSFNFPGHKLQPSSAPQLPRRVLMKIHQFHFNPQITSSSSSFL